MKKRLFAGLLALCMVFNLMPATAFAEETTAEPDVTEVVCEAAEDCAAEEHIETCAKYVAPVVVCEAAEDCTAETHIESCVKYVIPCTNNEDCLADEHTEGCPADVVYLPCPTEGCELVEGHAGECTGAGTYEEVNDKLSGSGTEADPYIIENIDDLVFFRDSVNAGETKYNADGVYVALGADIDLAGVDWSVNIGDDGNATFDGIFDGKNHTISNLTSIDTAKKSDGYICTGLFGAIYGSAVVKNLTIKNVSIDSGTVAGNQDINNNVSAVVGWVYKGTGTIENITVTGNISIEGMGADGVGTIVGYAYGGNLTIKNCIVDGNDGSSIKGRSYTGGIVGYAGGTLTVTGCTTQDMNIESNVCVGGTAGIILTDGEAANNTVKNVALTVKHENWQNSAAVVVGTITGKITVSGTSFENVTVNGNTTSVLVGSEHLEKPTTPVGKVQASVENVYYKTLQEAINAADGKTVTIINNVEITNTITVPTGKTVTVDLNGYSITGTPAEAKAYAVIENKGNLTITGEGAIVCNHTLAGSTGYAVNTIANSGTLIVNGGTIENKSTAAYQIGYAIDNNSTSYDAVLVINGGTVKASGSAYYDGIRQFCNSLTAVNSVEVKSGSVSTIWLQNPSDGSSERNTKDVKGSVSITGGTVDKLYLEPSNNFEAAITGGYIGSVSYHEKSEGRNLVEFITGGTFNVDPSEYVAEGYVAVQDGDNYVVQEAPFVAQVVGGESYKSLQDAIDAATPNATVKLLADIDMGEDTVYVAKNTVITLELNGYTLSGKQETKITKNDALINNKGTLTITDSKETGEIVYEYVGEATGYGGYSSSTIDNEQGTLNIEAGTITSLSTVSEQITYAINNLTNGTLGDATVNVNGGTVYAAKGAAIRGFANSTTCTNTINITDGNFTAYIQMQDANKNANKGIINISGGTFTSVDPKNYEYYALYLYGNGDGSNLDVNITGGTFHGTVYLTQVNATETEKYFTAKVTNGYFDGEFWSCVWNGQEGTDVPVITGGYFVYEPARGYIADGLSALLTNVKKDGVSYLYEIGVKPQGEPEKAITPAEPKTESKLPETATTEQKKAATQITNPETGKGTTSFESVLPEASDVATNMKEEEHTKIVEDLNKELKDKENVQTPVNTENVTIHVRPYLDVQVEGVKIPETGSSEAPEVTLDITMKYDVVASTEKDADQIVTAEDKEQDSLKTVNAVVTEKGKTLNVEKGTEVEITVPLPEVFSAYKDKIIVKHVKDDGTVYYYDAVVNNDGTITFINPNGFSKIIITVDTREAVVEFKTSDSTTETVTYKATDVNTTAFPTAEKTGYSHAGWTFVNVPGTYSGKMTDSLLTLLSALYGSSSTPIVAEPVFVEIPASSGGSSSDDSIAEEVKTEKPVPTASVTKETVETGKDELGALIGDSYGLFRLALSVKLEGELERATDIKIKVDGLTKADSIIVLQKTNDGWKAVPAIARDGYVICKFTSLSETLIFVNENGEVEAAQMAAAQAAGTTPAATGDSANSLAYVSMITVAAAGLAVLFFRRRRA